MLTNFDVQPDDNKRQLYVAMTRAVKNLTIHYNGNFLKDIEAEATYHSADTNAYSAPGYLLYHLTHRDINLGYFGFVQSRLDVLMSGDPLHGNDNGLTNINGEQVLRFSKTFLARKATLETQGFKLVKAKVNFILYWKNHEENIETEIKIILPELYFERENKNTIKQLQ